MPFPKNKPVQVVYEYDFSEDGGAVGEIKLKKFVNGVYDGLVIKSATLVIQNEVVSATGSATIGDGADDDGFFLDIVGLATGSYSSLSQIGGALLVSNVVADGEDVVSSDEHYVCSDTDVELVIETGAVTEGKFKVILDCVQV
jgi:hypothetical protein